MRGAGARLSVPRPASPQTQTLQRVHEHGQQHVLKPVLASRIPSVFEALYPRAAHAARRAANRSAVPDLETAVPQFRRNLFDDAVYTLAFQDSAGDAYEAEMYEPGRDGPHIDVSTAEGVPVLHIANAGPDTVGITMHSTIDAPSRRVVQIASTLIRRFMTPTARTRVVVRTLGDRPWTMREVDLRAYAATLPAGGGPFKARRPRRAPHAAPRVVGRRPKNIVGAGG